MLSSKGIGERNPDGHVRITREAKETLSKLVTAVLDLVYSRDVGTSTSSRGTAMGDLVALSRRVTIESILAYPVDRSCHTCDFERGGHCAQWNQPIPPGHIETGCGRHQAHGAPF